MYREATFRVINGDNFAEFLTHDSGIKLSDAFTCFPICLWHGDDSFISIRKINPQHTQEKKKLFPGIENGGTTITHE